MFISFPIVPCPILLYPTSLVLPIVLLPNTQAYDILLLSLLLSHHLPDSFFRRELGDLKCGIWLCNVETHLTHALSKEMSAEGISSGDSPCLMRVRGEEVMGGS